MIRTTDINNICRTSFNDGYIKASVNIIVAALGIEPKLGSADGKTKYNWHLEYQYENGNTVIFTIYDYKYYREIPRDEVIEFHIGNKHANDTMEIVDILKSYGLNAYYTPYDVKLEQKFPGIMNAIIEAVSNDINKEELELLSYKDIAKFIDISINIIPEVTTISYFAPLNNVNTFEPNNIE